MRTGWVISGALHAALILVAVVHLPWFNDREAAEPLEVAEVSVISAQEYEALRSSAPETAPLDIAALTAPEAPGSAPAAPAADAAPAEPAATEAVAPPTPRDRPADLASAATRIDTPEPQVEVESPVPAPDSPNETPLVPDVTGAEAEAALPRAATLATPPAPQSAPIIDTTDAPAPPSDAAEAEAAQQATSEVASIEAPPQERQEETAPEQTATAVTPDPASGAEDAPGQRLMAPPRSRPRNFEAEIAEREAEAAAIAEAAREAEADAAREAEEAAIAAALAASQAETAVPAQPAPEQPAPDQPAAAAGRQGPPLTGAERDSLKLAVESCWNVPAGLPNAETLVVTVAFELSVDGSVVGDTRNVVPATLEGPYVQAYEAARRAILRCQPYSMPPEKYDSWRRVEIEFDPQNMVRR